MERNGGGDARGRYHGRDGGGGGGHPREQNDEEELASKMLQIQSKRFYLDVKQNRRGRFLKIAEVGAGGRKTRIVLAMPAAADFRNYLTEFGEFYASLGPPSPENLSQDGRLKSETMLRENRRYYLDLKENNRGRFLRVTQAMLQGPRNVVVIPAQGLVEFRDALTKLLDEFGTEDINFQGKLPDSKQFRVDNKMFYFDAGQNQRGVFMRISEVKPNFRTAVTIPERSWSKFRDIFIEMCESMQDSNLNNEPVEDGGGDAGAGLAEGEGEVDSLPEAADEGAPPEGGNMLPVGEENSGGSMTPPAKQPLETEAVE